MDRITLVRQETGDQGTFGQMQIGDETLYTLELPWRDNVNNFSCIPVGIYQCRLTMSARFKHVLYLVDPVAGRFAIRIHAANLAGDVKKGFKSQLAGCIALGMARGTIQGQKAILVSKTAVRKLESFVNRQSFILEVKNGY